MLAYSHTHTHAHACMCTHTFRIQKNLSKNFTGILRIKIIINFKIHFGTEIRLDFEVGIRIK